MILTCPDCATRYSAKDDAIGPNGRTVRCSNCSATWFVSADPDPLLLKDNEADAIPPDNHSPSMRPAAAGPGAHVAMRDMADQRKRSRRLFGVSMIWGVTLGVLGLAAVLAYIFRQDVVDNTPRAATLYKAFGIEVKQSGLNFESPVTRSILIDGSPVLVVNGAVRNLSAKEIYVPMVELSLHSQSDETLATWLVEVDKPELPKGGRVEFASQYPNPPLDAVTLKYKFEGEGAVLSGVSQEMPLPIRDRQSVLQTPNQ